MPKYVIDFEFAGHVEVDAQTEKSGKEKVEKMNIKELAEYIQHFNVGKYYVEKMMM